LIGAITAATVQASLAGVGVDWAAVPSQAARTRQARAAEVRKTNRAPERDMIIARSPYMRFRGVQEAVAFTYMEVMTEWT
jgi:hypothetical protein